MKKVCRLGILYKIFAEETNTKNNQKWFSVLKMRSDMLSATMPNNKAKFVLEVSNLN